MEFAKQERKRIIRSSTKALKELDKLIVQTIDLEELDPEKAKAAAQGKIEAIEGSLRILNVIAEVEAMDAEVSDDSGFTGVENFMSKK